MALYDRIRLEVVLDYRLEEGHISVEEVYDIHEIKEEE